MHKKGGEILFYKNYLMYCQKVGKSKTAVAKQIGVTSKSVTGWQNGSIPRNGTLKKLADYFGVTVDDLLADNKKEPAGQGELEREWADIEVAYKSATPEARAAAKAAALAVLESSKKEARNNL